MKNTTNIIFGVRAIEEAIFSDKIFDKILVKKGLRNNELISLINSNDIPFQFVPEAKLNSITRKNHQGIVGFISPIEFQDIHEIVIRLFEEGKNPFILALDGVSDVRNFGAICRTAECSGIHAILIPVKGSAAINADAVKTSAGALSHIPVCRTKNLAVSLQKLQENGLKLFGASEKAADIYSEANYIDPAVLVMGAEDTGISDKVLRICDNLVKIPIEGKIGSLNVSVAAGVLMYEVVRQRN